MTDQHQPDQPDQPDSQRGDPWEGEMATEFDRRVRDLHEAPLTLDQVRGRATRIRRNRRAAVAGAVLAAAAVVVPVAIVTGQGDDRAERPPVASTTPSDDASTAVPEPEPSRPAYVEGSTLHAADGALVGLPRDDYRDVADLGDELVGYRVDDGGNGLVDVMSGGRVTTTYEVRSAMRTTPSGATVAFVTTADELLVVDAERGEQSLGDVEPEVVLAAIDGDGDCGAEGGCVAYLEHSDPTAGEAFVRDAGADTPVVDGALGVTDARDGLVAVTTRINPDTTTCGGLYDLAAGSWVLETCDHSVTRIAPDGRHVVGLPSQYDGLGPRSFSILDRDGEVVVDRSVGGTGIVGVAQVTWLDDEHVVVNLFQDGRWRLVSVGLDGEEETLVEGPSTGGQPERSPYGLSGVE